MSMATPSNSNRRRRRRRPAQRPAAATPVGRTPSKQDSEPPTAPAAPGNHKHRPREDGRASIVIDGEITPVYGNDTTSTVRMFPEPAAATCTSEEVWTPTRLRPGVEDDPDEREQSDLK